MVCTSLLVDRRWHHDGARALRWRRPTYSMGRTCFSTARCLGSPPANSASLSRWAHRRQPPWLGALGAHRTSFRPYWTSCLGVGRPKYSHAGVDGALTYPRARSPMARERFKQGPMSRGPHGASGSYKPRPRLGMRQPPRCLPTVRQLRNGHLSVESPSITWLSRSPADTGVATPQKVRLSRT